MKEIPKASGEKLAKLKFDLSNIQTANMHKPTHAQTDPHATNYNNSSLCDADMIVQVATSLK